MSNKDLSSQLGVCLVTGGFGWLGYYLVCALSQASCEVRILDIAEKPRSDTTIDSYLKPNQKYISHVKCDMRDKEAVENALKGVDTVFHLGCITDIRVFAGKFVEEVNINGTENIISGCIANKVSRIVYCSTIEVVNRGQGLHMADETLPRNFSYNVYGKTKAISEELVIKAMDKNIRTCIIRIPHLYGPSDYLIDATIAMPVVIGSRNPNTKEIDIKKKDAYSFIYIENAANVLIVAAKALASRGTYEQVNGEVFHVKSRDENFIHFYRQTLNGMGPALLKIPFNVILVLAYIYELIVVICFRLFGIELGDPVQCFGVLAVESCSQEYTFNDAKAQKVFKNYNIVDDDEAIQRTKKWIALRNQHKQKKNTLKKKFE